MSVQYGQNFCLRWFLYPSAIPPDYQKNKDKSGRPPPRAQKNIILDDINFCPMEWPEVSKIDQAKILT